MTDAENDLQQLRAFYDAFDKLAALEFKTPHGKEAEATFKSAVNEIIKPYLIDKGYQIHLENGV